MGSFLGGILVFAVLLAHTTILGRSGNGKSFLANFLVAFLQKYVPHTFILDMGALTAA
jgi:type IV secretory pathway VirB4 component